MTRKNFDHTTPYSLNLISSKFLLDWKYFFEYTPNISNINAAYKQSNVIEKNSIDF